MEEAELSGLTAQANLLPSLYNKRGTQGSFCSSIYLKISFIIIFFVAAAGYLVFRCCHGAVGQSSIPAVADLVVCMAFSDERADRTVALINQGYAQKVIATTQQTHDALLKRQVGNDRLILLAPSAQTTYQEAKLLWCYLQNSPSKRILVVSDGVHLSRVHWTIDHFFRDNSHQFWFVSSDSPQSSRLQWIENAKMIAQLYELAAIIYYWFGHGLFGLEDNPVWIDAAKKSFFFKELYHN
ncbi:MAG: YdcF family protein [Desulforhopalus sp.]|nr:YdcF family protein [Desulforhopalus sp.]